MFKNKEKIQVVESSTPIVIKKRRGFLSSILLVYVAPFQYLSKKIFRGKVKGRGNGFHKTLGFVLSGLFAWFCVPNLWHFSYDAVAFNFFDREEFLVFGKASELSDKPNVFRISACRKFPCEAQVDSVEFRIRDSLYLDAVWLFIKHEPYDPDELAGAFLSEQQKCKVTTYGKRFKYLGFYPYILKASCEPI